MHSTVWKEDSQYTSITIPGIGNLELTRMPIGAKASTSALYQAMVATSGETLYISMFLFGPMTLSSMVKI